MEERAFPGQLFGLLNRSFLGRETGKKGGTISTSNKVAVLFIYRLVQIGGL